MLQDNVIKDKIITIDGNRIAYRRQGTGPDVVFVHGWPLHRETWRDVVAAMPGFTCHLFDLPGAGQSRAADHPASFDTLANVTVGLIEHLGLDSVVLVGQDSGGMIARLAANKLGNRVTALILSGTEIPNHHPEILDKLVRMSALPGAARIGQLAMRSRRVCRSSYGFGPAMKDRDRLDGEFRRLFLDPMAADRQTMQRALDFLATYVPSEIDALRDVHRQIQVPVLAIWGNEDPYFPVHKARKMMEQFGGTTEFQVIDNARLLVHEELPAEFAERCTQFLGSLAFEGALPS